ncbi:MAG: protein translocase subunit SecD [Clostridiales bacterium]|nr:protein translocase subunit SecD [Clostridiales bacterium]MDY4035846.1 protein translocase subunit SecD [Candidatus Pseudoscilispira sp.]
MGDSKMKKKYSPAGLIVILLVIVLSTWTIFNGLNLGIAKIPNVKDGVVLGLDLVGGAEITYEADLEGADVSAEELSEGMKAAQTMLRERLTTFGYTEADVYLSGDDRVVVAIPNIDDPEEAVQMLGSTAKVTFIDADGNVILTGDDLTGASMAYGDVDNTGFNVYYVNVDLSAEGQKKFTEATKQVASRTDGSNYISIMMDDEVISAPYVDAKYASTGINSEHVSITLGSNATQESASRLAGLIASGQLPFSLQNIQMESVSATLGLQSLNTSIQAAIIGLILIILFMIFYYRVLGVASAISLIFFGAVFVDIISWSHLNLTLSGIAGIILTLGMAVDANIVIFERIKEELRAGRTIRVAMDAGFKNAFSAILDSNVTTCIAACCLWWQGTGTIVGFAKTLLIGVILSMFTMIVITRVILKTFANHQPKSLAAYGVKMGGAD